MGKLVQSETLRFGNTEMTKDGGQRREPRSGDPSAPPALMGEQSAWR